MFKFRKPLTVSVLAIGALCVFGSVALANGPVAADAAQAVSNAVTTQAAAGAADNEFTMKGYIGLAIGFGLGIAAFGGAMGQGRAAAAALEGIARNPGASGKIFTPMILGLALIESLVIYSLLISFLLLGKL
jgi:F-type H+-transporting ATPase subunit c